MRKPFKIGLKEYKSKKDAILHYRTILNSYNFGQSLNKSDYDDIIDLLNYDYNNYLVEKALEDENVELISNKPVEKESKQEINEIKSSVQEELFKKSIVDVSELTIDDIKIAKVQYNNKCFELVLSDSTTQYISYLMIINNKHYTPEQLFYAACRNAIQNDIQSVKQEYFDKNSLKGQVKCQETGLLSKWNELVVDHRQPNTFSIIVDRFRELNSIELDKIEYTSNNQNQIIFKDEGLSKRFKLYHKEKANLRIVRAECNSGRSGMGRIKRTSKDLTIK